MTQLQQAAVNLSSSSPQATIATLPLVAIKTADETVNSAGSGSTLQDDDDLKLALGADETWDIILTLRYTSEATPAIKVAIVVPSGANFDGVGTVRGASGQRMVEAASAGPFGGTGQDETIIIMGTVRMGATAGDVQLQWAQNTADAADTSVLIGSSIRGWRSG